MTLTILATIVSLDVSSIGSVAPSAPARPVVVGEVVRSDREGCSASSRHMAGLVSTTRWGYHNLSFLLRRRFTTSP